jgi:DNA-binding YbaB/EbfC family protein
MFQNLTDIFKMLKNAGPLQEQMLEVKERISRLRIHGEAGAGMVKVTVSGDGELVNCKVDPQLVGPEDYTMLEDLFIAATNDALKNAREAAAHEMKSHMGLSGMPGMDQFFNQGNS